ncbi:MAG: hypothetical protein K2Y37_22940 [Pirellulales bacterium]|nr:hypothetical protein [Pirellulales bacterium]
MIRLATLLVIGWMTTSDTCRAQQVGEHRTPRATPDATPTQRLQDRAFKRAKIRVTSSEYAYRRAESKRQEAIRRQLGLEALVQWRSGIVAASPAGPPWSTPGMPSPPLRDWPGSNDPYSPYWRGPFEPTPFWPGYIYGYPFIDPIEQPLGSKLTAKRGDPARGYAYEPVYASDAATAAARRAAKQAQAAPTTQPRSRVPSRRVREL